VPGPAIGSGCIDAGRIDGRPIIETYEATRDGFTVSTDPARLDLDLIHEALATRSYWAQARPVETTERAFANSLAFGLYAPDGALAGWARVITDKATFAYLSDVFVLEPYRGKGLSKFLVGALMAHPELQGLRRWTLFTRDAHGLYQQFGFTGLVDPDRAMEKKEA
jgi:GNAT superfamily N-acetyltransferase